MAKTMNEAAVKSCDCVKQVNEQLKPCNAKVSQKFDMNLKSGKIRMSGPMVMLEKIDSKNRKPLTTLVCGFCPFCGVKLD